VVGSRPRRRGESTSALVGGEGSLMGGTCPGLKAAGIKKSKDRANRIEQSKS